MSNELTVLTTLAVEINAFNQQVEFHKAQAVIYAAHCGEKLAQAKALNELNEKNEFIAWLAVNCPRIKVRNAYNYMRLAKEMPELLNSSVQTSALPNLSQAIKLKYPPSI